MYPSELTDPMRKELTDLGVVDLRSPSDVDMLLKEQNGTALVIVNSVCGCAAGNARPAVRMALQHGTLPDKVATVLRAWTAKLLCRRASISSVIHLRRRR